MGVRKGYTFCALLSAWGKQEQLQDETLSPVMDYGILKERFAAIATDGAKQSFLESKGYQTQILEFIDMEHTPKNLLIKAVKTRA